MTRTRDHRPPPTTDAGIAVASRQHSLTVGPDGTVLLQEFYLIEQMANFNRERLPELQPHAKGGGAFGTFAVTHDVSSYTKAAVFAPGKETTVVLRFSTVAGERGSPDTWRHPAIRPPRSSPQTRLSQPCWRKLKCCVAKRGQARSRWEAAKATREVP
jgi:catalase